jgi:hypothetical protein
LRILRKYDDTKITAGANFVPGRAQDQSSYLSELAGMFRIIVFILLVVKFYELDQVRLELACNRIEAIREISEAYKVTKSGSNVYAFIAAAKNHLAISPLKWKFRHVKGHQEKPKAELDIWERPNNDFDK